MFLEFLYTPIFNIFISLLFITTVYYNSILNKTKRHYFFATAYLIIFICIMEFLTLVLDGSPVKFRFFHILTNFLGFGFTPLVAYTLSKAVYTSNKRLPFFYAWIIYVIWLFITQFTGYSVFHVNSNNEYSRDQGFPVYLTMYFISLMLLLHQTIRISKMFKHKNNFLLFINSLFLVFGFLIQIFYPQIHSTWTCIIISTIMYYIYHDDIMQQIDGQTGLLNYGTFLKNLKFEQKHNSNLSLIVIELDNFKKVQQNFNRTTADSILVKTANHIQNFFGNFGDCYRIGTDEFCVLLHTQKLNFKSMNIAFFKEIARENFEMPEFPLTSLGYATFTSDQNLNEILDSADRQKLIFEKERLSYLYN